MKRCGLRCLLLLVPLFPLLLALSSARADTYDVYGGFVTRGFLQFYPLGLTPDGTLIEQYFNRDFPEQVNELFCPDNSKFCTFGVSAAHPNPFSPTFNPPTFVNATPCTPSASGRCDPGIPFDNGSPCTVSSPSDPSGPNPHSGPGICNNGHTIPFNEAIYLNQTTHELYYGPVGTPISLLAYGAAEAGFLFVNSEGDFAYRYFAGDYSIDYLFVDTSRIAATPEPSSFLLLGTGLAAAAVVLRRSVRRTR